MVCSGNRGRSPVAELVAREHLQRIGALGEYDSISSGTMVNSGEGGAVSADVAKPIARLGIENGLFSGEELRELNEALVSGNDSVLAKYFRRALAKFAADEEDYRRTVLPEFGLDIKKIKGTSEQIVPRSDCVAVLTMDQRNYPLVQRVYESAGYTPTIDVMSRLATGVSDAEVKNAFGKGIDVYRDRIAQIVRETPLAVDKVLSQT